MMGDAARGEDDDEMRPIAVGGGGGRIGGADASRLAYEDVDSGALRAESALSRRNLAVAAGMVGMLVVGLAIGQGMGGTKVVVQAPTPSGAATSGGHSPSLPGVAGGGAPTPGQAAGPAMPPGGSPTAPAGRATKLSEKQLKALLNAAVSLNEELEEYYGEHADMMDASVTPSELFDNDDDGALFRESENVYAIHLARALADPEQKKFILGTIGSSVVCGHDNCVGDNYQHQMMRIWGPVWKASEVMEFEIRNAGQGGGCGDTYENQVYCLKQMVGHDVDLVHYSWTYFEHHSVDPAREIFVRNALLFDKQALPAVWRTDGLDSGSKKRFTLLKPYAKYGLIYHGMTGGLDYGGKFGGKVWGKVGDGYHNTTRYGESVTDPTRRDSLGVVFRNWHPGPLGFQFTSDSFVRKYNRALINGIKLVLDEMAAGRDPHEKYHHPLTVSSADLPPPVKCPRSICDMDEPSECLNLELPQFGWHGAAVANANDDLNPYKGKPQAWSPFKIDHGPGYMTAKQDWRYKNSVDSSLECDFPDHCAGLEVTSKEQGWAVFKLPKMTKGRVSVCFCCNKNTAEIMLKLINKGAENWWRFEIGGKRMDPKTFKVYAMGKKCLTIMDGWPEGGVDDSDGHIYLGISLDDVPAANVTSAKLKLDHIVTQ